MRSRARDPRSRLRTHARARAHQGARVGDPKVAKAVHRAVRALGGEALPRLVGEDSVRDVRRHMRRALGGQQLLALDERAAWGRRAGRRGAMSGKGGACRAGGSGGTGSMYATRWGGGGCSGCGPGLVDPRSPDCTRSSTITTCRPRATPSFRRTMRLSPSRTLVQMTCARVRECDADGRGLGGWAGRAESGARHARGARVLPSPRPLCAPPPKHTGKAAARTSG